MIIESFANYETRRKSGKRYTNKQKIKTLNDAKTNKERERSGLMETLTIVIDN